MNDFKRGEWEEALSTEPLLSSNSEGLVFYKLWTI